MLSPQRLRKFPLHAGYFIAVVEDLNDSQEMGRVRIRVIGVHNQDRAQIPTEDLPWSHIVSSANNPFVSGLGLAPVGLLKGSMVKVLPIDDFMQEWEIYGTIGGLRQSPQGQNYSDPEGVNPKAAHDTNPLSRGEVTYTKDETAFFAKLSSSAAPISPSSGGSGGAGGAPTDSGAGEAPNSTPDSNAKWEIIATGKMTSSLLGVGTLEIFKAGVLVVSAASNFGGFGSGAPQNGKYTVNNYRNRTSSGSYHKGMNSNGVGFSFDLNPTFSTGRSLLRIHPDGNNPGTLGCIGVTGSKEVLLKVQETIRQAINDIKNVPCSINLTGNPNNSRAPSSVTVRE